MKDNSCQFRLRLPLPLKVWIEKEAEANYSTINAAITTMLVSYQRQVERDRAENKSPKQKHRT
jgi:vancomycin resistance protein YoaR